MRKPVLIELSRCGALRRTVLQTARTLPYEGKIAGAKDGNLFGLKGDVAKLARAVIEESKQASLELFGQESYEEEEARGIEYLKSLI